MILEYESTTWVKTLSESKMTIENKIEVEDLLKEMRNYDWIDEKKKFLKRVI